MPENLNASSSMPRDLAAARERIRALQSNLARCRKQIANAERETRCFRELAEHIQEVFWMTTPLGDELIYISPAYEHIWGQPCASLYEDPRRRLARVHEDDRERVLKAFMRDAASGDYDALAGLSTAHDKRRIRVTIDDSHEQQVDIRVEDNGDGIDEEVALFSPFTTTKSNGLGLGLSVSRSPARSHGGDLYVVNHGRNGSEPICFMLRLPRKFVAAA